MNIWYISKYASPAKYFFGTRHFYIAEEWIKTGNNVAVITSNSSHLSSELPQFKGSKLTEDIKGIKTIWLNTFKSRSSSGISRILSWLHFDLQLILFNKDVVFKPDVIIVSSLSLTTVIPGWILAKFYKAKFVFEVRDIWPLSIIVLGKFSKKNPFIRFLGWIEKFGYEYANLVVGTMPNLIGHVINVTKKEVKCICIPQGINLSFYENGQEKLSDDYLNTWIPKGKFIVCYAGTINANNPIGTLIKVAKLLSHNNNIHFLIVGKGDRKDQLISESSGFRNISFPPPVRKSQINDLLNYVDICYDSFESELASYGLSRNKWIDYMYAGKPIICSFNGFQSMINEADCGDFVEYGNEIKLKELILLYSNYSKRDVIEKGNRGKTYLLNNRTFDKLAKEYLNEIVAS